MRELIPKSSSPRPQDRVSEELDQKTIFFLWNRVIEEQYGRRGRAIIHPSRYRGRILIVRVASPLWANEIMIHRERLCERLNQEVGKTVIEEIQVLHGLHPDEPV